MEMKMIGRIHTDFATKFGVPRQSGLVPELMGKIVLEPEYRNPDAFRGLEEFSHLWLVWEFSEAVRSEWSPTVRPPRLGGNRRVGVFATRSPFRPNPIGLSCVKLEQIDLQDSRKPVIWVSGVDMMDGTPIYDIKPYLPYADSHPGAKGGLYGWNTGAACQSGVSGGACRCVGDFRRKASGTSGCFRTGPQTKISEGSGANLRHEFRGI